jgi:hypothetical protein
MPSRPLTFTLPALALLAGCTRPLPPAAAGPGVTHSAAIPSRLAGEDREHLVTQGGWSSAGSPNPQAVPLLPPDPAAPPPGHVAPRPTELSLAPVEKTCGGALGVLDPAFHMAGSDIPGGSACLTALDRLGVSYRKFDEAGRLLVLRGELGGIHYRGLAGAPLIADCRLILALHRVAPTLARAGVTEVGYSGAYSYRLSRTGRLSLHAYGLALDVHQMVVDGRLVQVERDFRRGLTTCPCPAEPPLNRVACALRGVQVFRELLTPDYNADHHDHFHWGVAPLSSERPTLVLVRSHSARSKGRVELAAQTPKSDPGRSNRRISAVAAPASGNARSRPTVARTGGKPLPARSAASAARQPAIVGSAPEGSQTARTANRTKNPAPLAEAGGGSDQKGGAQPVPPKFTVPLQASALAAQRSKLASRQVKVVQVATAPASAGSEEAKPRSPMTPDANRSRRPPKPSAAGNPHRQLAARVRAELAAAATGPMGPVTWETSEEPLSQTQENPERTAGTRAKGDLPSAKARRRPNRKALPPRQPIVTRASHAVRAGTSPPGEPSGDSSPGEWN